MRAVFGELFQLGHVVPEVDPVVAQWEAAGVGPWEVVRDFPVARWHYRGADVHLPIDVALAWSGNVQIELIAPRDASPSMYREYLEAHPEGGLQHYGFRCPDYDAALRAALEDGWSWWLGGEVSDDFPFCYLRPPATLAHLLPVEISRPPRAAPA